MLKIGLTGGIGCGKTTVAKVFAGFGVPIVDADLIGHRLVQPGQPALAKIAKLWGQDMLNSDGSLNRARLRERVFSDRDTKQRLEALLHPLIFQALHEEAQALDGPYCLLAIPLLFETNRAKSVDRILVVDCPVETQIGRVSQRDRLPIGQIQAIIDSQVPREYRLAHADDVLDNSQSDDGQNDNKLAVQVKKLHNLYLSISLCQD